MGTFCTGSADTFCIHIGALLGALDALLFRKEKRSRPISRVLSRTIIHLRYASPRTSSDLPGSTCGPHARPVRERSRLLPYLVLLRAGFAVPPSVATGAVRSYRTISPLPPAPKGGLAVCFLLHFPWAHAPQVLPGALPWEPGLSSTLARSDCLADSGRDSSKVPGQKK